MKTTLLLFLLLISSTLFSQKFTLEGVLKDQDSIVLNGATVYVQSAKDSVPIAYGITNKNGEYSLRVNAGEDSKVIFNIASLGYESYIKIVNVPQNGTLNMGYLVLNNEIEELDVITIIARAPPVLIKKDTVEYNADSFKTLPNDKAEDLLKKLPGVEIDLDGIITVNGIEVEAINVDGMRFFGEQKGDIALKNLPSNVISKVQVTDYKTDNQKFTGEESDSGTKEINFKIKKGKNRATFGDVKLGYGTDEKYQANANVFKLIDGKQLGIIGGTNNINLSKGFNSLPDTDTSNGDIKSDFVGANYTKGKWNETSINGNYRYSAQNRDYDKISYKETFLPDLNYITDSKSNSFSDSDSHTAGADLKFILKPKNNSSNKKVRLSNKTDFKSSSQESGGTVKSKSYYDNGDLVSDYTSNSESSSSSSEFKNEFSVTPVLNNKADYLNVSLGTDFNKSDSDSQKYSKNVLVNKGQTIIQDQINTTGSNSSDINFNAFWSKELFTNFRLMPRYMATVNTKNSEKYIYDFDERSEEYSDFNELLSSESKYVTTTLRPALKLRYQYKDFRFEVEGAFTNTYRDYKDKLVTERDFKADFEYLTYSGRIRYKDENGYKNITLQYNQNVDLPSVGQLQPLEDVSNITHIVVGNPLLKPAISHNARFQYQNNLAYNNINISGNLKAQFVQDKIINSTITDADLNKYTTYDNIDGDYSYSGNVAVSKSYFNRKTNINLNARFNASYKNSLSIQNAVEFTAKTTVLKPLFSVSYAYDSKIDVTTTYSYSKNNSVYDTDAFNDINYFVQNVDVNSNVFFLKNAFLSNRVSYRYNSSVGDEFDGDAVFWNAGLGVELWDNQATLSLVAYDMLGKNNGYRRSVTETYIQDVENKILEQYFMLNFVYKFGSFAGQKMNVKGKNRGGGGSRGGSGRN
ncbi:outer membrane beta-barrel family protein [Polaribacter undariae]|uniref:Outer membrane beta-barrel family protein n=1 Tax=Polaribacter sejongensis TaxID=985043 RepID=A0AAJ1QY08_9FLAO|nr:outer membrane beta-barrel family protein [Polaribacter undariae]MDN3619892.1 outer membrane beta-barrel family protein [Polaribacter undariae]UWD31654.1 outer membrane beta-barrel family protein [Polaribacter undariae]